MIARSFLAAILPIIMVTAAVAGDKRPRALGIEIGILDPGPLNAITDVDGVRVGHATLSEGARVNTGVTAVLPAEGNLRQAPVPAAVHIANGYGKLAGVTQIRELGEIETPILLTNTLNVAEGIAGVVEWTLAQPGNADVRSVNAIVGETNDGFLNDIRARLLTDGHVIQAIERAESGPVEEGVVGAGQGTRAFGWKGGIGTSSRALSQSLGGWRVGVLVQTNMGGILTVDGVPVGEALGRHYLDDITPDDDSGNGSIMMVAATDAPLSPRNLERLAKRAIAGLARTGAAMTNGSGDYVIAFSTHPDVRRTDTEGAREGMEWPNTRMSPLFQAVAEATEEAILNSLFMAETVDGHRGRAEALPVDEVMRLWREERIKDQ